MLFNTQMNIKASRIAEDHAKCRTASDTSFVERCLREYIAIYEAHADEYVRGGVHVKNWYLEWKGEDAMKNCQASRRQQSLLY